MLVLIEGVVNVLLDVSNAVPPVKPENQLIVSPEPGVAFNVTVPAPHLDTLVADGVTGCGLMVAITGILEAYVQPEVVFLAWA